MISDPGSRVMHAYLLADPGNSTLVEVVLWTTLPALVEWPAVSDAQVFDAMAGAAVRRLPRVVPVRRAPQSPQVE